MSLSLGVEGEERGGQWEGEEVRAAEPPRLVQSSHDPLEGAVQVFVHCLDVIQGDRETKHLLWR